MADPPKNIFQCKNPRVSRLFEVPTGTDADSFVKVWFDGTVVSSADGLYHVAYDDGDTEKLSLIDVLESVAYFYHPKSRPPEITPRKKRKPTDKAETPDGTTKPSKSGRRAYVVTPNRGNIASTEGSPQRKLV